MLPAPRLMVPLPELALRVMLPLPLVVRLTLLLSVMLLCAVKVRLRLLLQLTEFSTVMLPGWVPPEPVWTVTLLEPAKALCSAETVRMEVLEPLVQTPLPLQLMDGEPLAVRMTMSKGSRRRSPATPWLAMRSTQPS